MKESKHKKTEKKASVSEKELNKLESGTDKHVFSFTEKDFVGNVFEVTSAKVAVRVSSIEKLKIARVDRLAAIKLNADTFLIGRIEKVYETEVHGNIAEKHVAEIGLIGSFEINRKKNKGKFTRAVISVADIESECYCMEGPNLSFFMGGIAESRTDADLPFGHYVLDKSVVAYINGNKLLQRHVALLGSSGCGKSWTVTSIIEKLAPFNSADIVIFDIHGEYKGLKYAKSLRMATPADAENPVPEALFMPAWFLSYEELLTVLVDPYDPDSSTHALVLHEIIKNEKLNFLKNIKKEEYLKSFTIDSPIPYDMNEVLVKLKRINRELVPGIGQGNVQKGPYYGKFDRFIPRIEAKKADKRYNFLFEGPKEVLEFDYINKFVHTILGTGKTKQGNPGIKFIDFSMVPSEMLPVIISTIGRFLFQVMFWNEPKDRHPIIMVCDEAHLYLPPSENANAMQRNCTFNFGRIAKEGRKYGVTLFVVSQRPSDLNPGILSQCANFMTLRLTNANDQEIVKKLMPDAMSGLIESLPILGIGEGVVIGEAVMLPLRIQVTPPNQPPVSPTLEFCNIWLEEHDDSPLDAGIDNMRKQSR
ncbi:ATP-binding protein [Candidatus Margulisiibacteriota bacterium]